MEDFGARGFHSGALACGENDCEIQLAQLPTSPHAILFTDFTNLFATPPFAPPPGIDPGPWASKAHVLATTQWRNLNSIRSGSLLMTAR